MVSTASRAQASLVSPKKPVSKSGVLKYKLHGHEVIMQMARNEDVGIGFEEQVTGMGLDYYYNVSPVAFQAESCGHISLAELQQHRDVAIRETLVLYRVEKAKILLQMVLMKGFLKVLIDSIRKIAKKKMI